MTSANLYTLSQNIRPLSQKAAEIREPTIWRYFQSINAGKYDMTAELLAPDAVLNAPFEEPIVGRETIAAYLTAEAEGMQLYPLEGVTHQLEDGKIEVFVTGKVDTPLFGVNVSWQFILNYRREIVLITVQLLADSNELLSLRSQTKFAQS